MVLGYYKNAIARYREVIYVGKLIESNKIKSPAIIFFRTVYDETESSESVES